MSKGSGTGSLLAVLGLGLCCGGPALFASGALGVIGGALARAWPMTILGAGILAYAIHRWRRRVRAIRSLGQR